MTNSLRRSVVVLAALAALVSCKNNNNTVPAAAAGGAAVESPDAVLATWGDNKVTAKDVDAQIGAQLRDMEKKKNELRKQAAEQVAVQGMVRAEAAKLGQTEEQYLKANIDAKLPPPSDAEIAKVFEENKAQMPPGSTLESMRERIIQFMGGDKRREVAVALFEELKAKNNFKLMIEEPRTQVEALGPSTGPTDAKVTIVEFSDFQCPFCSKAEEAMEQVKTAYAGKVRVVFRHFPLSFHDKAEKAAEAGVCAQEQGKFWEMHKQLFANQSALSVDQLKEHAKAIGLDTAKFNECLDSGRTKAQVDADMAAGQKVGVSGTPAFFINGVNISGAQPFAEFDKVIKAELAAAK